MEKEATALPNTILSLANCTGIIGFGDLHVEADCLEEIADIITEINELGKKYKCSHVFQEGDLCEKVRLYPKELYELVRICISLRDNFYFFGALEGNHDKESKDISIISFLKLLGITICEDETILKTPFGTILLGHWFLKESKDAFGTHQRYSLEELQKKYTYDYCFLGHQHDYQKLDSKTYHTGSSRYVNFGENPDLKKRAFIINQEGLKFIELKSVIPMFNVSSIKELENIPARAKVRYIFKSFAKLKDELKAVDQYKNKFVNFKKKLDFTVTTKINTLATDVRNKMTNAQIIEHWLNQIQDQEVRKILETEFQEELK